MTHPIQDAIILELSEPTPALLTPPDLQSLLAPPPVTHDVAPQEQTVHRPRHSFVWALGALAMAAGMLLGVVASLEPVQAAIGLEPRRGERSSKESPAAAASSVVVTVKPAVTPQSSAPIQSEAPMAAESEVEIIPRTALKPAAPNPASSDSVRTNEQEHVPEAEQPSRESAEPSILAGFDASAARESVVAATSRAQGCHTPDGPTGTTSVLVTFAPSGRVTQAVVTDPPLAGTTVGGCVAAVMRSASVPAYNGDLVTVSKRVTIE